MVYQLRHLSIDTQSILTQSRFTCPAVTQEPSTLHPTCTSSPLVGQYNHHHYLSSSDPVIKCSIIQPVQ